MLILTLWFRYCFSFFLTFSRKFDSSGTLNVDAKLEDVYQYRRTTMNKWTKTYYKNKFSMALYKFISFSNNAQLIQQNNVECLTSTVADSIGCRLSDDESLVVYISLDCKLQRQTLEERNTPPLPYPSNSAAFHYIYWLN